MSLWNRWKYRKLRAKMEELGMRWVGDAQHIIVADSFVSEFNPYVRMLMPGSEFRLQDFDEVYQQADTILIKIAEQFDAPQFTEEVNLKVARSTAEGNMQNLRRIVRNIVAYVDFCAANGFELSDGAKARPAT